MLSKTKPEKARAGKTSRAKTKLAKPKLAKAKSVEAKSAKSRPVKINLVKKRSRKEIVAQIAAENRAYFECLDTGASAGNNETSEQTEETVHYSLSMICGHCGGAVLFNPESQGLACGCPHCSNELILSTQEEQTTAPGFETSVEEMEAQIRSHIAAHLAQNPSTKSVHVAGLKLFPAGGIHYKGAIELEVAGQSVVGEVIVDYNNESFTWTILPQPVEPMSKQHEEVEPEAKDNSLAGELAQTALEVALKCFFG